MTNSKDDQAAPKMHNESVHDEPDKIVEPEEALPEITIDELPIHTERP